MECIDNATRASGASAAILSSIHHCDVSSEVKVGRPRSSKALASRDGQDKNDNSDKNIVFAKIKNIIFNTCGWGQIIEQLPENNDFQWNWNIGTVTFNQQSIYDRCLFEY